ncbi:MAG: helix-turn-helix domain-containing protein [Treponema sp.]|nr:helix-turn-helix domain-containing protein [Treponema sp.]
MEKPPYLREILAQNIKNARISLCITQEKLAEYASISVPYMRDIEYCKSWVSDETLDKIAKALSMEAYELLIPQKPHEGGKSDQNKAALRKTTELIIAKKKELRKKAGEMMDELMHEIIQIHGKGK